MPDPKQGLGEYQELDRRLQRTDELLTHARVCAGSGLTKHALDDYRELDRRLSAGHVAPAEWRRPLLEVEEHPLATSAAVDSHKLRNVLHDELQDAELDCGARFLVGKPSDPHDPERQPLDLEALAGRLAGRLVRELLMERRMIEKLLREQTVQQLTESAERTMDEVRKNWAERP